MAFYGYNGEADACYWTPHTTNFNYDYDPSGQASSPYSYHEFNEPVLTENSPVYNYEYDLFATTPEISNINYSAYNFNQPKLHQYDPTPYVTGYVSSGIKYTISYSTQKFSVPIFEEYDPTPYGGGYDQTQVYGKPLPPSNQICYPLSKRRPGGGGFSLDGFSFSSIPSPYGKKVNHSVKPENRGKGSSSRKDDDDTQRDVRKQLDNEDEKREDGYGCDYDQVVGNGRNGENSYEFSRQVPQIPYGSGLKAMDICECLFGHFPCLAKINQERCGNQEGIQRESNVDPWKSTADYLFGWPSHVYSEQKDGYYGDNYIYGHGNY